MLTALRVRSWNLNLGNDLVSWEPTSLEVGHAARFSDLYYSLPSFLYFAKPRELVSMFCSS